MLVPMEGSAPWNWLEVVSNAANSLKVMETWRDSEVRRVAKPCCFPLILEPMGLDLGTDMPVGPFVGSCGGLSSHCVGSWGVVRSCDFGT